MQKRNWREWTILPGLLALLGTAPMVGSASAMTLSAYDRVSVTVVNGEEFSSAGEQGFVVGADGNIFVPQLGRIPAAGREELELQQELAQRLREYIRVPDVQVRLVSMSSVAVDVSGSVYRPGLVTLQPPASVATKMEVGAVRTVYNAIKEAGGVRPDANLAQIELERNGQRTRLPLGQDVPVISGDRIVVASLGPGQYEMANLPSQLAPEQITVYVSGQDLPSNAVGPVKVRPGTTLAGALTAAGGSGESFLRGGRQVTLIRTDPTNGQRTAQNFPVAQVMDGTNDLKLLQDDSIVVNAGSPANAEGFLSLIQPLLMPFVWLFR
ncbi:glr0453 [Gloeobacter violaceus PCC 7421]|uniref:Glr0453 protein n=2 Tax=Gloeobacter violaceus TaxID=33072 RepID=Q7NNF8_GLOVI|nr:glr0453 [Gloeobacter violaceus PCC 7421]